MAQQRPTRPSGFPTRLLIAGYAIGAMAGIATYTMFGHVIAAALVIWLGGAVATLACGAVIVYGPGAIESLATARRKPTAIAVRE